MKKFLVGSLYTGLAVYLLVGTWAAYKFIAPHREKTAHFLSLSEAEKQTAGKNNRIFMPCARYKGLSGTGAWKFTDIERAQHWENTRPSTPEEIEHYVHNGFVDRTTATEWMKCRVWYVTWSE